VILAMGRLAIACGGTGGHLFPGLAIAEAVRRRGHEVRFFISAKPVDRRALSGAGESGNGVEIPAVGWTGLFGAVAFLLRLVKAVRKAGEELVSFRADALLGMGGICLRRIRWRRPPGRAPVFPARVQCNSRACH